MEEPLSGWFDCLDDQRHCCCAFWVLVSFVGPHNILRLIQVMVIKINSSPTPPLRPQTQFLSFSKFITSYTYSLLLLRRSLKSSHPILVHEYSIILLILPFQNLIIIIRCIELKFEHLSAHPLFFIPFLLIHINTGTYSHHSYVCMRVE